MLYAIIYPLSCLATLANIMHGPAVPRVFNYYLSNPIVDLI